MLLAPPKAPYPDKLVQSIADPHKAEVYQGDDGLWYLEDCRPNTQRREVQPARCYNFDGVDDYVSIGGPDTFDLVLSCWFKLNNPTGNLEFPEGLIGTLNNNGSLFRRFGFADTGEFVISQSFNSPNLILGNALADRTFYTSEKYNDSNWHFFYCEINNNNVKVYIDNVLVIYVTATEVYYQSNYYPSQIGVAKRSSISPNQSLSATIWNFQRWSIFFNESDRGLAYQDPIGFIKSKQKQYGTNLKDYLKLHLKADEGDGTTSFDSSGNGNDGTINNATLSSFHTTDTSGKIKSWQNEVGYGKMPIITIKKIKPSDDRYIFSIVEDNRFSNGWAFKAEMGPNGNSYGQGTIVLQYSSLPPTNITYYIKYKAIASTNSEFRTTTAFWSVSVFKGITGILTENFYYLGYRDSNHNDLTAFIPNHLPVDWMIFGDFEFIPVVLYPRNESSPKLDIFNNKPTYNMPARLPMQIKGQSVGNFDGVSYVDLGSNILSDIQNLQVEFSWIPVNISSGALVSIHHERTGTQRNGFTFYQSSGFVGLILYYVTDQVYQFITSTPIQINEINTLKFKYSNDEAFIEINNNREELIKYVIDYDGGNRTTIGAFWGFFSGNYDQFLSGKIWNVKLTNLDTDEVVLHLPFSETAGSIVHDISGNDFHGTWNNHTEPNQWSVSEFARPVNLANGFFTGQVIEWNPSNNYGGSIRYSDNTINSNGVSKEILPDGRYKFIKISELGSIGRILVSSVGGQYNYTSGALGTKFRDNIRGSLMRITINFEHDGTVDTRLLVQEQVSNGGASNSYNVTGKLTNHVANNLEFYGFTTGGIDFRFEDSEPIGAELILNYIRFEALSYIPAKDNKLDVYDFPLSTKGFNHHRSINPSEVLFKPNPFNAPELIKAKSWDNTIDLGYADLVESNPLFVENRDDRKGKVLVYDEFEQDRSKEIVIENYVKSQWITDFEYISGEVSGYTFEDSLFNGEIFKYLHKHTSNTNWFTISSPISYQDNIEIIAYQTNVKRTFVGIDYTKDSTYQLDYGVFFDQILGSLQVRALGSGVYQKSGMPELTFSRMLITDRKIKVFIDNVLVYTSPTLSDNFYIKGIIGLSGGEILMKYKKL